MIAFFSLQGSNPTEDVTITDEKDPETTSQSGSLASERGIDIGRVGSWATDFEKLLTDPIGLRTFAVSLEPTSVTDCTFSTAFSSMPSTAFSKRAVQVLLTSISSVTSTLFKTEFP